MGKFNLAEHIQKAQSAQVRDIETITAEIQEAKLQIGENLFVIGRGLIEAKAQLPHGEWLTWLTWRVEFSEATAQNYMKLVRKYSNPEALRDLGYTKALMLLALPDETRDEYIEATHIVGGEEKTVAEMSTRELKAALKERDEALKAAAQAQADQRLAEKAREKMAEDMRLANERVASLNDLVERYSSEARERQEALATLNAELESLKTRPVEVAVQADPAAVEAARKEAEEQMQAQVDTAKKAQAQAEEAKKAAEKELEDARHALYQVKAAAQAAQEKAEKMAKRAALTSNEDLVLFRAMFDQVQELVNKMSEVLLKVRPKDQEKAQGLSNALLALSEKMREVAGQ